MATTAPQTQAPPRKPKMTLGAVTRGKIAEPITVLLYGVEGIGKSTFGAGAPRPIVLDGERGTTELDVSRFPTPENWADVREALRTLYTESHDFGTLVVDTLDWLEPLLWDYICTRDKQPNIEAYGYGKGYVAALDEWRIFLADLEKVRARGMNVVLLAHSWIKPFKNPEGEDFDRYELKLNAKAGGLLKEWPKAVLFANYETIASKDPKSKRVRGVSTGARFLYTNRTAAYDAKNRYNLPEQVPLGWADFEAATKADAPVPLDTLIAEIKRKASQLDAENEKKALAALDRANGDASKLSQLNSWCNCRVSEKAANETAEKPAA